MMPINDPLYLTPSEYLAGVIIYQQITPINLMRLAGCLSKKAHDNNNLIFAQIALAWYEAGVLVYGEEVMVNQ